MTTGLHDTGEEYILDVVMDGTVSRVTSCTVGLYNDSTDALSESSDVGDITTEPTGSNYSRQTINLNDTDVTNSDSGGDWQSEFAQVTYDTSDSTQSVDSYFVVINYQADDTSDSASNDHLFFTGSLDGTYDLSNIDTLNLSGAGASIS